MSDSPTPSAVSSPHPPVEIEPCHVGIVFAVMQEAGGVLDRLAGKVAIRAGELTIHEGGLAGRRVAVVVSGAGRAAASRACDALIAGHRPTWVLSSGFSGGLVENVRRGDVVVASDIVDARERVALESVDAVASGQARPAIHTGRFVTVDELITTPEGKRRLAAEYEAIAVDMESLAVATICQREGVRFLGVRIISDTVDETLPGEVSNLLKQTSFAGKLGALAGAAFKRPSSLKDMYQLKEDALIASDKLAAYLEGVVKRLT